MRDSLIQTAFGASAMALAGLLGVVWYFVRSRRMDRVKGTVVEHELVKFPLFTMRSGLIPGGPSYLSVFEFEYGGRMHRVKTAIPSAPAEYDLRDVVDLRVPPGRPDRARVVRGWSLILFLSMIGFGGITAAVAIDRLTEPVVAPPPAMPIRPGR